MPERKVVGEELKNKEITILALECREPRGVTGMMAHALLALAPHPGQL